MVIAHNMAALDACNKYRISTDKRTKSTEKLSSGYRINKSADDAAGLSISEKMRWQIRGLNKATTNSQDGISYLQVADGALGEVHDMLHRMKELSVQASSDTNTDDDRTAIQSEIEQIQNEIDRIGSTTEFNTKPVFKGRDVEIYADDGSPVIRGDVPTSSYSTATTNLGKLPFESGSDPSRLNLSAVINNNTPNAEGVDYPLLYGKGSTSHSYVRLISQNGQTRDYDMQGFKIDPNSYSYDAATNTWSRSMSQNGIKLTQKIQGVNESDTKKYYNMSYTISNENADADFTNGCKAIFMFNADTAYGGNNRGDYEESYFTSAGQISNNVVYSKTDSALTPDSQYAGTGVNYNGIPDSISIINTKKALSFSEKIEVGNSSNVINLAIGHWSEVNKISYFDNKSSLTSNSSKTTNNEDLGFSIAWDLGDMSVGNSQTVSFKYGIVSTQADNNLNGVTLNSDRAIVKRHYSTDDLWIQSGALQDSGVHINVEEMNSDVIGILGVNVEYFESAQRAITSVDNALDYVSKMRSKIGAQQNRLEHTVNVDSNTAENTQDAESKIRDTDMAAEMVEYAKHNILSQVGTSMVAQANSSKEGILSLLQ